jgi:hypothetical protein
MVSDVVILKLVKLVCLYWKTIFFVLFLSLSALFSGPIFCNCTLDDGLCVIYFSQVVDSMCNCLLHTYLFKTLLGCFEWRGGIGEDFGGGCMEKNVEIFHLIE